MKINIILISGLPQLPNAFVSLRFPDVCRTKSNRSSFTQHSNNKFKKF